MIYHRGPPKNMNRYTIPQNSSLFKRIVRKALPFEKRFWIHGLIDNFVGFLKTKVSGFQRTPHIVKRIYERTGTKNIDQWKYAKKRYIMYQGRIVEKEMKLVREYYLSLINREIGTTDTYVFECGCGNILNIQELKKSHGDKKFVGIDIAHNRLRLGLEQLKLDNSTDVSVLNADAFHLPFKDKRFDIAFTVHCLEQIGKEAKGVLKELERVTKRKLILIEPIYEYGNTVQKLYLLKKDYLRGLLKTLKSLQYKYQMAKLDTHSNPFNPSGLIIIKL